eukprot:1058435-Amphidinium_carterae.2
MAHGGPSRYPRVAADLSTVRVWQRRIAAGKASWLLSETSWEGALRRGRGRGPISNLRLLADCLQWVPRQTGWRKGDQHFSWDEADYKAKCDSSLQLCKEALRQLKQDGQSQKDSVKTAFNAAFGGVWHEVRCGEAVEDLEHNVHHCLAWVAEKRDVALPTHALHAPACVRLHGLLPAPQKHGVSVHEPALVSRPGVHTVWTDGSGRHMFGCPFRGSSNPSIERNSRGHGVVSCLHALRVGRRHPKPKGRHRDLENRALAALPAGVQIVWMKAHQSHKDADEGRVARSDLQGNRMADAAANKGTSEHVPLEPSDEWKQWSTVCQAVSNFWLLVGPKLR